MSRAPGLLVAVGLLAGCVSDVPIEVELRPPRGADGGPDVPVEVERFELRLYRTDEGCPSLEVAASARPFARLGAVWTFSADEGMGESLGELPPGRWALAVLARDAQCGVRLYGCAQIDVGVTAPRAWVVPLAPAALASTCGACRACQGARCDPPPLECP